MMPGIRLCYSPNFSALPFQLEAEQVCFDFSFGIPIGINIKTTCTMDMEQEFKKNFI